MKRIVLFLVFLAGCAAYVPGNGQLSFYASVISRRAGLAIVAVKIENGTSEDLNIVSRCAIYEDNLETESRWVETFVPKHAVREFTLSYGKMDKGTVTFSCKHYRRNR